MIDIRTIGSVAAALLVSAATPCLAAQTHPPLALAVFAPDPHENAFGPRHLASQMGIPYFFTHNYADALRAPMMIVSGSVDGRFMTESAVTRMHGYLAAGGVLVVDDGETAGVQSLAGIADLTPSEHRYEMTLDIAGGDPGFARLRLPEERTIRLGNKSEQKAVLTQGYKMKAGTDARVLAHFDDGTAALVMHRVGKGRIYVTGLSYFDAILRPQDDGAIEAGRVYDNGFEPSADVPQLMVRDWYLRLVPGAVVTDPTPDGLAGALIITHDVDYTKSVDNMLPYVKAEKGHGFSSTYFVQAKTIRDVEDNAFFDARARRIVASVFDQGGNIASHTVAHAPDFRTFPVGNGTETSSTYKPFVKEIAPDRTHGLTLNGSLTGEVKVSQERLDACAPGIKVDAFRPGYLLVHRELWTILARYGYRFDSSYAAGEVMTAFPYVAMEEQGDARESGILEFPIVLADAEGWVPMLPHMATFNRVLDDESEVHGVVTTLIHTDVVADKLPTELALVAHAKTRMWIGSIDAFGDFWNQRAETTVTSSSAADGQTVTVASPHGIAGLTLDFPDRVSVQTATGTTAKVVQDGRSVLLGTIGAGQTVTLELSLKHS